MMELDPQTAGSLRTMLLIVLGTLIFVIPVIGAMVVIKLKADAKKVRKTAPPEKTPEQEAEKSIAPPEDAPRS